MRIFLNKTTISAVMMKFHMIKIKLSKKQLAMTKLLCFRFQCVGFIYKSIIEEGDGRAERKM